MPSYNVFFNPTFSLEIPYIYEKVTILIFCSKYVSLSFINLLCLKMEKECTINQCSYSKKNKQSNRYYFRFPYFINRDYMYLLPHTVSVLPILSSMGFDTAFAWKDTWLIWTAAAINLDVSFYGLATH
jgi:hypothetical protein